MPKRDTRIKIADKCYIASYLPNGEAYDATVLIGHTGVNVDNGDYAKHAKCP